MTSGAAVQTQMEAFAFRKLVEHLQMRTDVQNIDLMNLAGFCRNCLAKWYVHGARLQGVNMTYDESCHVVYGMPLKKWKSEYQTPATPEQLALFADTTRHAQHPELPPPTAPLAPAAPGPAQCPPPTAPKRMLSDVCCQDEAVLQPTPPQPMALAPSHALSDKGVDVQLGVLTVSDRASQGEYADLSGPQIQTQLKDFASQFPLGTWRLAVSRTGVVPDEQQCIESVLKEWSEPADGVSPCNLILTTGGTGFALRDVTPEATQAVLHKAAAGLMTAVLLESMKVEPLAMLSRAVAGIRHRTLIINLPGRPNAVRQNLQILLPVLGYAVQQVDGQL
uniref:molybdopterin molybdotransferase n=1 Tax=Eutreptiella gymnastica TaxID=73025 RepID=A0A7S1J929_9EUGL